MKITIKCPSFSAEEISNIVFYLVSSIEDLHPKKKIKIKLMEYENGDIAFIFSYKKMSYSFACRRHICWGTPELEEIIYSSVGEFISMCEKEDL